MPNIHGIYRGTLQVVYVVELHATAIYILSQNWPKKFSAQSHVTPDVLSVHEPPCLHGLSLQVLSPVADKEIAIR